MIPNDSKRVHLALVAGAAALGALLACGAEPTEPASARNDGGTASGGSGLGGTAGSAPAAGSPGTSGAPTGGTGGSPAAGGSAGTAGGGGGSSLPPCTSKIAMQTPAIADFEGYDGMVAAAEFQWPFGGSNAGTPGVHAGTYAYGDGSAEPALALLAGHGGNYGLSVSVTGASSWGLGFGMFLMDLDYNPGCIDASQYKGISMWVRGSVPTGTFSFGVTMPEAVPTAQGGTCTGTDDTSCKAPTATDLPVTTTWTQVDVLWADLIDGLSGPATPLPATGDNITGFNFGANLTFMPESEGSTTYVPVPGDITIAIDDLAFIP